MSDDKLMTPADVAEMVEVKGLDCAITDYIDAEEIEPGPLRDAWGRAKQALQVIEEILDGVEGDEEDDD